MRYSILCRPMRPLTMLSCSLCFGPCVVRVASLRAPGPVAPLHDRFNVYIAQPQSHLALFVCSGFVDFFFEFLVSRPCADTLSLSHCI